MMIKMKENIYQRENSEEFQVRLLLITLNAFIIIYENFIRRDFASFEILQVKHVIRAIVVIISQKTIITIQS